MELKVYKKEKKIWEILKNKKNKPHSPKYVLSKITEEKLHQIPKFFDVFKDRPCKLKLNAYNKESH